MSAQPQSNWFTLTEYFALERASERRFEYRNGEVVCMSGGTRQHTTIGNNLLRILNRKLGAHCRAYGANAPLYVPAGQPYRYADTSIICGEPQFRRIETGIDALENPVAILEVLSRWSADYDKGTKFEEYKSISTFAEYLLISQDRPQVTVRRRNPDGSWIETVFESLESTVRLESCAVDLTLRDIYEGVDNF